MNSIKDCFKVYVQDIGIFMSMFDESTVRDVILDKLYTPKEAVYENLVADILSKNGHDLFYFRKDSGLEIDFLIRFKDKATLLEVKASNGNAKSAKTILANYDKYHVDSCIKLGTKYNIGFENNILTLPTYLAFLL